MTNGLDENYYVQRLRDQVELIQDEYGDRVAWDSAKETPEDLSYLYDPDVLLMRTDVPGVGVGDVAEVLAGGGFERAEARELPSDESGRAPLALIHVVLPRTGNDEEDRARVPRALDLLDGAGFNDDEENLLVGPDSFVHLAGNTKLCPASEPKLTDRTSPWPGETDAAGRGADARVGVVDSGWNATASSGASAAAGWVGGVGGDPEPGPMLPPYGGHGTFIAGVVRCRAPGAEVYVERFVGIGGALPESRMVRQLRETLLREPHIINLSAGATTRKDRPLMSFERFWKQDLHTENCLLVAAAGNDGTDKSFYPAAFDWAIGVGSLDHNGAVSAYSNFAKSLDVYAVGQEVVNAFPIGTYTCRETPDKDQKRRFTTGLAQWSGTSFAAPVVVGLIAAELTPGGNVADAWDALLAQAGSVKAPDGRAVPALLPPYS